MSGVKKPCVIIGRKPVMTYVTACLTLFHQGYPEVEIRARGKAISKAVDVVATLKNCFMKDLLIKKVIIGTELVPGRGGKNLRKTAMTIIVGR